MVFRKLRKHFEIDFLKSYEKFTVLNGGNPCLRCRFCWLFTLHIVLVRKSFLQACRFYIYKKIKYTKWIYARSSIRSWKLGKARLCISCNCVVKYFITAKSALLFEKLSRTALFVIPSRCIQYWFILLEGHCAVELWRNGMRNELVISRPFALRFACSYVHYLMQRIFDNLVVNKLLLYQFNNYYFFACK